MLVVNFRRDERISQEDRSVLREYCLELGGNPVALANRLGVKVFEDDMPYENSGYIDFDESCGSPSGYRIVVNKHHSMERKKFTIAHEIGHFVLHRDTPHFKKKREQSADIIPIFGGPSGHRSSDDWDYNEYPRWMENEANGFAACVLLPQNLLKKTPEYINGEPIALARRLGFSSEFVLRRFEEVRFGE